MMRRAASTLLRQARVAHRAVATTQAAAPLGAAEARGFAPIARGFHTSNIAGAGISAQELSSLLEQRISGHYSALDIDEIGRVLSVATAPRVYGLNKIQAGEISTAWGWGMALNPRTTTWASCASFRPPSTRETSLSAPVRAIARPA